MNTKLCLFALGLCWPGVCSAQFGPEPNAATSAFFADVRKRNAELKQRTKQENEQMELAAARDSEVAALRADLATPWTSLIIALRRDESPTAASYRGFCLTRAGESVTVAPWIEKEGKARSGESRAMTKPEQERLLSETALFYLAATLAEAPSEKAGPQPCGTVKAMSLSRISPTFGRLSINQVRWMNVRVTTPDGVKQHSNMWGSYCPDDFWEWIAAFGTVPQE